MQSTRKNSKKQPSPAVRKHDYESKFAELHGRVVASGITAQQLSLLTSVKRLRGLRSKNASLASGGHLCDLLQKFPVPSSVRRYLKLLWAMVVLVGLFRLWYIGMHRQDGWVTLLVGNSKPELEPCVVAMPARVQSALMPPVDCAMCRGLKSIERKTSLSQWDFELNHAYTGVPVVVTDGASNWTALRSFSLEFFKNVYASASAKTSKSYCQFFPYKTEFRSLSEVFNMSAQRSRQPWYIGWSNCDAGVADVLRRHYASPYFLPPHSEGSTLDWIFMGSPGYGAHLHIDHVGKPSWQAQIRGRKQWILEPVPECYSDCQSLEIVVNPGEIFVVDSNLWYHKTLIVGDEVSIAIGSEYD
ncbi:hypothetical protein HPB47_008413 [Ixodes persulcatus]|uniref:Uncharacterized protein n=1 Tax=Ixodes persulcatus TaxID=34615 RepID=A0AC60P4Z2_IXOPE|nr:hypothetical protein HPB47_008413 [Ixodes persulcatus]